MLTEYVRIALRRHLCRRFSHNKTWISVLRLGDGVEHLIRDSIRQTSSGTYSALEEAIPLDPQQNKKRIC